MSNTSNPSSTTTAEDGALFLFGDQTDGWSEVVRRLYKESRQDAILEAFLRDATTVVREQLAVLEPRMTQATGGSFTDLLALANRFRDKDDLFGLIHTVLVCVARAAKLIQSVSRP